MARSWYRASPDLYESVRQEVEDVYPELRFVDDGTQVVVRGWYPLYEESRVWDRYLIEVVLPTDSPRGFPTVREVGGRIPHDDADRHVFTNGIACIALEDAFWFEYPEGLSLLEFLNGPMRSYFASQSLMEKGEAQAWPAGEWAHGVDGIFQFYTEAIGIKDPLVILEYLKLLEREEVKGHWPCPCRSGEKLRKCHGALVYDLRSRIPRSVAAKSLESFQKAVEKAISQVNTKT
jgi:hypothetical protein